MLPRINAYYTVCGAATRTRPPPGGRNSAAASNLGRIERRSEAPKAVLQPPVCHTSSIPDNKEIS
jgi:hypothetical protein